MQKLKELFSKSLQSIGPIDQTKILDERNNKVKPLPNNDSTKNRVKALSAPECPSINLPNDIRANINLLAGLHFVQRYEDNFAQLHQNNKHLAQKAEVVDKKIQPISALTAAQHETWQKLHKQIQLLPDYINSIECINQDIDAICKRIELLERIFGEQEYELSQMQLQHWELKQKKETEQLRNKKLQDVGQLDQELRSVSVRKNQQEIELEKLRIQERIKEQEVTSTFYD